MLFKRIEMQGFKSFAEPVTIEFDEGITGIVGPNGSGKSNISDAIRWVLGEQSPKMLRGGKMEEVIFNGTSNRKSRGMAEVTLVIDNDDEMLPIEYKEVAITRKMFRSGESEYHINGNQCRLRDIRELIMDTGIGVDGYSLIGQGKISDIISNKTESRREIFEEAAGVVAYRTKKVEAERKLQSATANMERVRDIIGEIEGRIDGLREDSVKAEEYLKLRDRHKELEINIILKNVENLELKNEYAKDDLMEVSCSIDALKEEKRELDDQFTEANARSETLETLAGEAREDLLKAIEERNAVVNKGEVDRERLSAIETSSGRFREEIEALEERKLRELKNAGTFADEKKAIDEESAEAERILEEKTGEYDALTAEVARLTEEADDCRNRIFELSGAIHSGNAEISSLELLQETLERRKKTLLSEKSSGDMNNRETLDGINAAKNERRELEEELEEKRAAAEKMRAAYQSDQREERALAGASEELRIAIGRLSARKKTIEEMESNYEGYNYAVKHVMKSGLSGIHGVVADLLNVPKGYEVAIETALGASIQNIVCEDDESAKRAIRSLKENRAGRMTFLPLRSIKAGSAGDRNLRTETGFEGFGTECVEYDSKYGEVVKYLLGRVVVVNTMDNAVRISKKVSGMRVVTLEGEIINAGGAITGGRYKNRTANILERKTEIAELKKEIDEKSRQQRDSEKRLEMLREKIRSFADRIGSIESEIRTAEHALIAKDNEIAFSESALKDIKGSSEKIERELSGIKEEQERSRGMVSALREKLRENEEKIEETKKRSEAKLEECDIRKTAFDRISEEITKARIAVTSCNQRKAHADDIVKRITETVLEIDRDIKVREDNLASMAEEKKALTAGHTDIDDLIREKEFAKTNAEEYLRDVTEEKAALTSAVSKINEEREELAQKLQTLQDQKVDLNIRKAKNETQLESYKEKLWEDFEVSYIQAMDFKSDQFVMSLAVRENRQIKSRIRELGEVNVGAIEEYGTVRERYEFLTSQQVDIQEAMDTLSGIIRDMDKTIRNRFKDSFDRIVINFEEQFRRLFGGGHAELRLSDESNPLESNIDIVAQPPGKRLQNINLLSGGEKTLTAIALMFAVLQAKPTPFCILDEVEAALDDANIDRFIDCLRQFEEIQFALVTHQKATMEHADVLYGVTMPEKGVSKVLSLDLDH